MRNLITVFCSFLLILSSSSAHCRNVVYPLANTDLSIVADHQLWQVKGSSTGGIVGTSLQHPYSTNFRFWLTSKPNYNQVHKLNPGNKDVVLVFLKDYAIKKNTVFSNVEVTSLDPARDEQLFKGNFFSNSSEGVFYFHIASYSDKHQRSMFVMFDFVNGIDDTTESIFNEVMGLVTPLYSTRGFLDGEYLNEELFEESLID